jgi:hypothetical protein
MTVRELQEELSYLVDQYGEKALDIKVYGVCDYGDYGHTQQLVELTEPRMAKPHKTAYSQSGLAVSEDEEYEDEEEGQVVVLG